MTLEQFAVHRGVEEPRRIEVVISKGRDKCLGMASAQGSGFCRNNQGKQQVTHCSSC
jgi:hypothetical protein